MSWSSIISPHVVHWSTVQRSLRSAHNHTAMAFTCSYLHVVVCSYGRTSYAPNTDSVGVAYRVSLVIPFTITGVCGRMWRLDHSICTWRVTLYVCSDFLVLELVLIKQSRT
jgi:hypothetical protein